MVHAAIFYPVLFQFRFRLYGQMQRQIRAVRRGEKYRKRMMI